MTTKQEYYKLFASTKKPTDPDTFNSLKGSLIFRGKNGEEKQIVLNNCEDFSPQWQISPPCYSGR